MSISINRSGASDVADHPTRARFARLLAPLASVALVLALTAAPASAASAPTLEKLSRHNGPVQGGQVVTISGNDFSGATAVSFGSTGASFAVASSKRIHATVPSGIGTVDVTVTTLAGTSATSPADLYTYEGRPPAVTKLSISKGPAAGGTVVAIGGENFFDVSAVHFGSVDASSFTVNSEGSITAVSPAESVARVDVTVTTPLGTSAPEYCGKSGTKSICTIHDHFKFLEPTVSAISPAGGSSAGGEPVTIAGTGFETGAATTTFLFGKTPANDVECPSSTECTALTPEHKDGTVDVKVVVTGSGGAHGSSKATPGDQFVFSG